MASPNPPPNGFAGFLAPARDLTDGGAMAFIIRSIMGQMFTAMPVRVVACTRSGALADEGFVDVQLLVNQVDGDGNAVPRGVVHNVPFFRLRAGGNAVIMDPEPEDIGICIFASHDISSVKANRDTANPGSYRRFDPADAIYIGGILGSAPSQSVRFHAGGIDLQTGGTVTIDAPNVKTTAALEVGGDLKVAGASHLVGDTAIDGKVTAAQGDIGGAGTQAVKLADGSNATKLKGK